MAFLCDGDITQRDAVLWGYTLRECKPYIEVRQRQQLFREAVIAFIIGPDKENAESEYCKACKTAAKRNGKTVDCDTCSKDIKEVAEGGKQ